MATTETAFFNIPSHIVDYLRQAGYEVPYSQMKQHIQIWDEMLRCEGSFWNYDVADGAGHIRKEHRLSVKPAKRVCKEIASLVMDGDMRISTDDEQATEWLNGLLESKSFISKGQSLVRKGFALGTAAWVLWLDVEAKEVQLRRYDARMIIPLSWDEDGVTECAFVSRAQLDGNSVDQLQLHTIGERGTYEIRTRFFDIERGKEIAVEGVESDFDTQGSVPWFGIFTAEDNDLVDFSPYGQSFFADAVDVLKSVDTAYDALFGEVRNGKRLLFVADTLIQVSVDADGNRVTRALTSDESGVYRMVDSMEEMVKDFAPALRVDGFEEAYHEAIRNMGDQMGFGADYFVVDKAGGLKTAKEVAAAQSALMRNLGKYEARVEGAINAICTALLNCGRLFLDAPVPENVSVSVTFDDSIIEDTDSEKAQDMAEVAAGIMPKFRYLMKWHGLDEDTARMWVAEANPALDIPAFEG